MSEVLEFVGEPFDAAAFTEPVPPPPPPPAPSPVRSRGGAGGGMAEAIRDLRSSLVDAHASALGAQAALQRLMLASHRSPATEQAPTTAATAGFGPAVSGSAASAAPALVVAAEGAFKPLARTGITRLDGGQLARLADGDIAGVFGWAYDQDGANPAVRLGAGGPLALTSVEAIELRGGAHGMGRVAASCAPGDLVAAAVQAAQLFALHTGLHLCLAGATFTVREAGRVDARGTERAGTVEVEVTGIDLLPRPWVRVDATFSDGGQVRDLVVALQEAPGALVGPARGGVPSTWLGRKSAAGERAMLSEFHMTHLSRGDQGIALGPEFAHYTGRKATRLPTGGLLLVDRVINVDGARGKLDGATYETEYDAHADSWYFADTANASMPNCVYMETSLQAALLIGYHLGPTLTAPEATMSLRNLGGTATVLREVDLRDKTIRQRSELLATTILPGSSLQSFAYELSADGEPFYRGETMFGYFSDEALGNQTGLDAGKHRPTWLDEQSPRPATLRIDIAGRRADPAARLTSRGTLALLDHVDVVDGGGRYGQGYLHAVRPIDPGDWFFQRHFHLDPVIPGSLGVESVIQAMQEWLLASGHADTLTDPEFIVPADLPFTWKYRGQFLPTDCESTLEVHIKEVRHSPGRVRVVGEASMWKPGLRIYELEDIAIELRSAELRGARR
ncbi:hotdog family protein [Actinokineospora iranica]|uniref:3-hydroxymyristoyl/3-hydroxydecanoyl-(Acyl carrier protein) dehydratase n=1 Tax=Actinokineospora iranica TaxID=1271860 RepID=A0A1G6TYW0_9PSEU|nr:beta-ketoacyl synthase [Actinokineospora iranica]SDD34342.1 3-hydroxymyristoyl/3-hydroxydecanoyl-(acyl carrier protein) dehydratase [Actinokineospora iranica]